jgi:SNF2 family DNA or RNA helicase
MDTRELALSDAPVKVHPFSHQLQGCEKVITSFAQHGMRGGYGLFMEMGTGKTLTSIMITGKLFEAGYVKRVLILSPTSVCGVWVSEFMKFADFPVSCTVLDGSSERRSHLLASLGQATGANKQAESTSLLVAVLNYECTWRMEKALLAFKADLIIADEAQRIKTPTASQSKAVHRLGDAARFRLALSGTPVQNSPLDFWSIYRFLDTSVFGTSFYSFKSRYAVMGGYRVNGRAVQITGYRFLEELTAKVYTIAYRVTKADALDLPPFTFEIRPVTLSPSEARLYRQMAQDALIELDNGKCVTAPIIVTKLIRLQQLTGGFIAPDAVEGDAQPVRQVGTSKLDALKDILQDYVIDAGNKLVVFARFVPEVLAIYKLCQDMGIASVMLYGKIKKTKRPAIVEAFQKDPACKVFVAQIETAGVGITLHAASTAVLYSVDFNYASYEQALARIHRAGQTRKCTYINLVVPGSIDEHILEALERKEDLATRVVDGWKSLFQLQA